MTQTIEEFWRDCCEALPAETAGRSYRARRFGDDPIVAQLILDLISAGEKTGTFAVDWEFEDRPGERPAPGDLYVVTDHSGMPGALIRITATETLPFNAVSERHVQCEGPALRQVGPWRKLHWEFWSRTLARIGRRPAQDMPILYQQFELLYPRG